MSISLEEFAFYSSTMHREIHIMDISHLLSFTQSWKIHLARKNPGINP